MLYHWKVWWDRARAYCCWKMG